jgi:hypothetical protein
MPNSHGVEHACGRGGKRGQVRPLKRRRAQEGGERGKGKQQVQQDESKDEESQGAVSDHLDGKFEDVVSNHGHEHALACVSCFAMLCFCCQRDGRVRVCQVEAGRGSSLDICNEASDEREDVCEQLWPGLDACIAQSTRRMVEVWRGRGGEGSRG